jgi:23S rRNA (cytosine1962-C5)-methyltransferase
MQKIHLRRTKRLNSGHLWIFSNEIHEDLKGYEQGSLVEVFDKHETFLGIGYINPKSLISARLLSRNREKIDAGFLRKRIMSAVSLRERIAAGREACRLIYSEGDYLPGLIADRYGSCIVLQFLTYGMEAMKDEIISLLDEIVRPDTIVVRNDSRIRVLEGLPLYKEIVKGSLDRQPVINEDGLLFEIDPFEGQKTGFFLDQRDNRVMLKRYIKGGSGLDLFSYMGGWAMHLASAGASVACVDVSERASSQCAGNAELNGLSDRIKCVTEDVFSFLKNEISKGEGRYDFIVLDPPAFVKSASRLREAEKAYREINESCMRLVRPGGLLATSSCSYHMGRELFIDMLSSAGKAAERNLRLLEFRSQSPDHPVLLSMPETEYLKCAILMVD